MVPTMLGSPTHANIARENLQASATVEFLSPPALGKPDDTVTMTVRVTNVGAGHKLPTGFPEGREMWVDFRGADASGKEIYRLGAVRDGRTELGTRSFKVTMADDAGNIINLEVWRAGCPWTPAGKQSQTIEAGCRSQSGGPPAALRRGVIRP